MGAGRDRRRAAVAAVAQALAAGLVGAFVASIVEPPAGARWALLAAAVGSAAVAAWARSSSSSAGE